MDKLGNSWAAHNLHSMRYGSPFLKALTSTHRSPTHLTTVTTTGASGTLSGPSGTHTSGVTPQVSETTWNAVEDTWDTLREAWAMSSDAPFNANLLAVTGEEIHDIDVLNETFKDDFTSLDGKVWQTMLLQLGGRGR